MSWADEGANTKNKPGRTCARVWPLGTLLRNSPSTTLHTRDRPAHRTHTDHEPFAPAASHSSKTLSIPLYNILWAELSPDQTALTIDYAENTSKTQLQVAKLSYPTASTTDSVAKWADTLLTRAYGPATHRKRALVLVNPHAGPGHAEAQWTHEVQPLFAAARMSMTVHTTTRSGEAIELARTLDIAAYDIIAPCGGDGGPHEIFRGLGMRADARRALQTVAVAHVPCGSGNALACNALGTSRASLAALAIVKGVPTPMDLVSITQGATRSLSFLSQTLGVMAEADLGTEHLRWMGQHRFTYGTVKQILKKKEYACDLWVKMEIDTKEGIRAHYKRERTMASTSTATSTAAESESELEAAAETTVATADEGLPPLQYGTVADPLPEEWIKVDADHMGTLYTGNVSVGVKVFARSSKFYVLPPPPPSSLFLSLFFFFFFFSPSFSSSPLLSF